ncbi:MAG: molybdopterin-dependent oxidoreductase [Chloroflexi bacterium]|nr:molybdopterin-dependent oxidoreductase [Chloroflexota bacterium]
MIPRQRVGALPVVSLSFWSFAITGSVRHTAVWSYAEISALPRQETRAAVTCSTSGLTEDALRFSTWRGVPIRTLLSAVTTGPDAHFARLHSTDGYTTVVPVGALDDAVLALERDGAPLTEEDGFPARFVLPARSGYKQAKWVERIELISQPVGGLWEDRGYDVHGSLQPGSSLTVTAEDGALRLSGTAFANGNLSGVQISIDGGDWVPAKCDTASPSPDGLHIVQWQRLWRPPHTGIYELRLRIEVQHGTFSRPLVKNIRTP